MFFISFSRATPDGAFSAADAALSAGTVDVADTGFSLAGKDEEGLFSGATAVGARRIGKGLNRKTPHAPIAMIAARRSAAPSHCIASEIRTFFRMEIMVFP